MYLFKCMVCGSVAKKVDGIVQDPIKKSFKAGKNRKMAKSTVRYAKIGL